MNTDEIMDAIGKIDLKYVQEAETYHAAGKGKRAVRYGRYKRLLPAAACLALMIIGGGAYGLWSAGGGAGAAGGADSGALESAAEDGASDAAAPAEDGASDSYAAASGTNSAGERIYVNETAELAVACYDIAGPVRLEYYSAGALEEYYGVKIVPQNLPGDLTAAAGTLDGTETEKARDDAEASETPKKEQLSAGAEAAGASGETDASPADETVTSNVLDMADAEMLPGVEKEYTVGYDDEGNVLDDNNELGWQNDDGTRSLRIAARTVPAGEVVLLEQENLEYSQIAGYEVMLTHYQGEQGADCYLALYEKNGVTVTVKSCGMAQEELVDVLRELLADDASYNRAE